MPPVPDADTGEIMSQLAAFLTHASLEASDNQAGADAIQLMTVHSAKGLEFDAAEGERIARGMQGAEVAFLANHGAVVCGAFLDHAFDDLYMLERACMHQVLAQLTGRPLAPVSAALAARVSVQTLGERLQTELFFEALRRRRPPLQAVPAWAMSPCICATSCKYSGCARGIAFS